MMIAPSSTQVLTAIPTDYGPDPSTPFTRALTLPASERPPARELRKLLGPRRIPEPDPAAPLVRDWVVIPPTAQDRYVTGGSALNVPDPLGRPGGDWHDGWSYMRPAGTARRVAEMSTDDADNPALQHVLTSILGAERLLDLRPGLIKMAHPQATEPAIVWGASHERATVEYVLAMTLDYTPPPRRTTGTDPRPPDRVPLARIRRPVGVDGAGAAQDRSGTARTPRQRDP